MSDNTVKQFFIVDRSQRRNNKGHSSFLIWFTGLSGSGKSTIANEVEKVLFTSGIDTYTLDGDNVRQGLNKDLSFNEEDRTENIRRIAEVANLMVDAGTVVLAAFISPFEKDRQSIRAIVGPENYFEVYVSTPISTCEKRDVKGLYAKARKGEISSFTGIDSPYEEPLTPDVRINTADTSVEEATQIILKKIEQKLKNHE
ncbi:MAG: adenylyl-sulfate kinase [Crocinitomicaceae bacterium]|nr:adenylyl-sulfate kinase [Crocinitomicaceae bacterium]